jgi:chemotaxis protein CheC
MRPVPELAPRDLDALQEVASIGCGQGLTALGKLLRRPVHMDIPESWVGAGSGAIADFLGAMGEQLVAVAVSLEGLLTGHLVLGLPERDAQKLAAGLGYPVPPGGPWDAGAESALMESCNILGSAFVSAIARMVDHKLLLSVPRFARGGGRECIDALVPREAGSLAFATRFSCGRAPEGLEGLVLVMPDPAKVAPILGALERHWHG